MNTMVIISEEENEKMIDIIEELNALKVLAQTLAANNELYHEIQKCMIGLKRN